MVDELIRREIQDRERADSSIMMLRRTLQYYTDICKNKVQYFKEGDLVVARIYAADRKYPFGLWMYRNHPAYLIIKALAYKEDNNGKNVQKL